MNGKQRHLHRFHGGLHLPANKAQSNGGAVRALPLPKRLILPLSQHIGEPAEVLVKPGERVLKGQMIARARGYVSVPIHASSSGTVIEIADHAVPHPSGLRAPCVIIETDGKDEAAPDTLSGDPVQLDPNELRNRVRNAGIVGLGGAGFPSFIKLNPGANRPIHTLLINGAECEPYITCDDLLMREHAHEVVGGARIVMHALHAAACIIAIEDNKPEAAAAMRAALAEIGAANMDVVVIPTIYPTGGEKQLIKVITGREVPSQGLPADVGIVCHNPGTAAAVYRALMHGEPLISRIVTVTGAGVAQPGNFEVRIGTPMADVIAAAGGYTASAQRLLMGGPMMGFAMGSDTVPIVKTSNCLLVAAHDELPLPQTPSPCIRCGACVDACPADLLPQQLYWYAHVRDFDKIQDYSLFDCIECGCCAHVCPSHLPLVHYYRFAKTEIWAQEREREKADIARQRHEFRLLRIEREKDERAERLKQKQKALQTPAEAGADPKKAAIQAALERAKAKKASADVAPKNTDNLSAEQQQAIAAIDARRATASTTPAAGDDA
ncbi:MAG: electron transport complex subunit RsxC [Gammaproteobacteria bacterium]|nr:electron transport complex subunit RsxC [Gammaproteobacteria bacterium]